MQNAIAFSNNDVITVAWSFHKKPEGCMGFTVYRINEKNEEDPLPSKAVFKGFKPQKNQTTEKFPLQKFYWKDVYARLIAETTGNRKFRYKIVALEGQPGKLQPMKDMPVLISNEVEITGIVNKKMSAWFNRGLISTPAISRAMEGKPNKGKLLEGVADEKSTLRERLSGDMVEALMGFLNRARKGGKIYAALYELHDEQLITALEGLKNKLYIVLSDSKKQVDDPDREPTIKADGTKTKPKKTLDDNEDARKRLIETTDHIWHRIMPSSGIGHNKFLVYVDKNNKPAAVLFGSTNWTATGLCTQTNNTVIVDDAKLAKRYLDYWKKLKQDTVDANDIANDLQGTALRTWDSKSETIKLDTETSVQSWFSPNTPKKRGSKTANEKRPPDMDALVKLIDKAKHSILFLAFYPGSPSAANWTAAALKKNKKLFVRGCVTNKSAAEGFYYELQGVTPPKKVKGEKTPIKQDYRVFGAEAFDGKVIPPNWQKEILSAGFAIIHDKIVVIDPFSADCVVATGSHNIGHKASYNNDENFAIIKGNTQLAKAYATHILDVYDHFATRYFFKNNAERIKDFDLKTTPDEWLDKYYDAAGKIKNAQLNFWLNAK